MFKKAIASFSIVCALSLTVGSADTGKPAKPAPSAKVEASAPASEKTIVYIKAGSRYHVKGCQYLRNKGTAITVGDAIKQGYAPCNVCHAPKLKRPD